MLGAHSHDSADQVDETLEADADGRRALLLSLLILAVTAAIQAAVVLLSGSVALLGDTLHNVADALTAVPLLIAFRLARRPATKRYTYGYGRAEDLGGLFVIAMITLSSVLAAWEAIDRLIHPRDVTPPVDRRRRSGRRVRGQRDRRPVPYPGRPPHRQRGAGRRRPAARTDGFTSLAVLLGAGGVAIGWRAADPIIGLVIAVAILGVAPLGRPPGRCPADGRRRPGPGRPGHRRGHQCPWIKAVRELRIRWIGHTLRAEVDATVDPGLTVTQAHDIAHHAETHLLGQVRRLTAATIHTSPTGTHAES